MRKVDNPIINCFTNKHYVYIDQYGAQAAIDFEHSKIHDGDHYFYADYHTLTGNGTIDFVIAVDGCCNHFTYSVNSDQAGFSFTSYEGVTANTNGTTVAIHNNNRESAHTTCTVCQINPTGISTTGATLLRRGYAGTAANPSQRSGGSVSRDQEAILRPDTKYLIRITNLSSATNDVQVIFNYYEAD